MKHSVAVTGDACLDIFVYCSANRLAPDLPIPVLEEVERSTNPGMAANVSRNIKDLGFGVDFIAPRDWEKTKKVRYIDKESNHHFVRIDQAGFGDKIRPSQIEQLLDHDLVVVSDYNKGFLSDEDLERITASHDNVIVDSKRKLGKWSLKARLIKLNRMEFRENQEFIADNLESKVVVTLGPLGARFQGVDYKVRASETRDLSGAGDAFFAALASMLAIGGSVEEGIRLGNLAGAHAVGTRGIKGLKDFGLKIGKI